MSKKNAIKNVDKKNVIRIVAVALVIVLIAVITIIQVTKDNPRKYVDEDGVEHLLYIDEEGNTVLSDNGQIVVYATDIYGDIIKGEDGEPQTNNIDFPDLIIEGNNLETPYYKMTMPESWTLKENGEYVYNENPDVTVQIVQLGEFNSDAEAYAKEQVKSLEEIAKLFEKEYPASSIKKTAGVITMKNIICRNVETIVGKTEDDIMRYSCEIFFVFNGNAYEVFFNCENYSYAQVKDAIDIYALVHQNLAMKDKVVS